MTQPYLYMRNASGGQPQCIVVKEINGQLIQIGNTFGTSETKGNVQRNYNRAIHWGNNLLAINHDTIYKYDINAGGLNGTGAWEVFHAYTNYFTTPGIDDFSSGFVPCSIDGSGVLCTMYPTAFTSFFRVVQIDKDMNVKTGPSINGSTIGAAWNDVNAGFFFNPLSWRNNLIWRNHVRTILPVYDLKTDTLTAAAIQGTSNAGHKSQNTIFRDKVYTIEQEVTTNDCQLNRLEGGLVVDAGEISPITMSIGTGGNAMVAIGDKLYTLCWLQTTAGNPDWYLFEVTIGVDGNVSSVNDISNLLPIEITSDSPGGGPTDRLASFRVDNTTNGPENPIYELEVAAGINSTVGLFTWDNAPSGNINFVANRMTAQTWASIHMTDGSAGPFIWTGSGTLNISQPCLSTSLDGQGVDVDFEIFGPPGESGLAVEAYFSKEGQIDTSRCTINSPTVGSLSGNTILGLSVGDKFSLRWEAVTDGIVTGDNPKIHGRVFLP